MNGISKYHSGIIETGKCTIEDFSDIGWYSIYSYEWYFHANTIQGIIATGKCIIENFNGTEWYSIVMNATVFPNTIRSIIETGKCTIEDYSGTEWYSIVMNVISKYHSGYHWDR